MASRSLQTGSLAIAGCDSCAGLKEGEEKKMFLITVKTLNDKLLFYHVIEYKISNEHVSFVDTKTGYFKSYPLPHCTIEQVEK